MEDNRLIVQQGPLEDALGSLTTNQLLLVGKLKWEAFLWQHFCKVSSLFLRVGNAAGGGSLSLLSRASGPSFHILLQGVIVTSLRSSILLNLLV